MDSLWKVREFRDWAEASGLSLRLCLMNGFGVSGLGFRVSAVQGHRWEILTNFLGHLLRSSANACRSSRSFLSPGKHGKSHTEGNHIYCIPPAHTNTQHENQDNLKQKLGTRIGQNKLSQGKETSLQQSLVCQHAKHTWLLQVMR